MDSLKHIPEISPLLDNADHIDVKTFESEKSLRHFIADLISYQPAWMTFLYRIRWFFVRLLGMKQTSVPKAPTSKPSDISFIEGDAALFFKVVAAEEDRYWFAEAAESHLTAKLGVVAEPNTANSTTFHVVTVVHYNHWTGPVYFNVIRPFHHLVVGSMGRHASRPTPTAAVST
ncbi:MAG: DUF2867 domain-containing protein [Chloroflexota bacterium]